MINSLFGINPDSSIGNHYYTFDHLLMVIIMIAVTVIMLMLFLRRSAHVKKVLYMFSAICLILLQICKLVYRGIRIKEMGEAFNFWKLVNVDLASVVVWLVVPILFVIIFSKHQSQLTTFCSTSCYYLGATTAIFFMIMPFSLESGYALYHAVNIVTILTNFLLLFVGFFAGFADFIELKVQDLWYALIDLIVLSVICLMLYFISGQTINVMFINNNPILSYWNADISFPLTLLLSMAVFFIMQLVLYLPIKLYSLKIRDKD